MQKMAAIMERFHGGMKVIGGERVIRTMDYSKGLDGLPASDVLKFYTESGSIVVRPSGTEPKLKAYISVTADNKEAAQRVEGRMFDDLSRILEV